MRVNEFTVTGRGVVSVNYHQVQQWCNVRNSQKGVCQLPNMRVLVACSAGTVGTVYNTTTVNVSHSNCNVWSNCVRITTNQCM